MLKNGKRIGDQGGERESGDGTKGSGGSATHPSDLWFDILSNSTPDNLFIIRMESGQFYFHWANESLEKSVGLSVEENQGKSIREILGDEVGAAVEQNYQRCLERGQSIEYEEVSTRSINDVRYWHTLLVPQVDKENGVSFVYGVSRDITEIVSARKDAEHANQVKAGFLAHMGHEIKTPLNSISGALSLLEDSGLNESQRQYLKIIDTSKQVIVRTATDVLDYAKLEAGQLMFDPKPFDLSELVYDVHRMMLVTATEKQLVLNCHFTKLPEHSLLGDSGRIVE